jgi:hypothetical protein
MSELPTGPVPDPILSQISEDGLEELFRRDPLLLTKKDLTSIIDYFRAERHRFQQMEAEGKFRKKKSSNGDPNLEQKKAANAALSLDNLDI